MTETAANSMALNAINHFFSKLNVSEHTQKLAKKDLKVITASPSEVLLAQGNTQHSGYFIVEGILSAVHYSASGEARCKEYYFAGELSFLYAAWLTNSPVNYQLEAVNSAQLIRFPLALLTLKEWQVAKLALLEQQLLYKEAKEAFLLLNTPEERYLHLCKYSPHWVAQLTNIQLAAYIGISPISLSRIKNRVNKRKLT